MSDLAKRFERYTQPEPNSGCLLWLACTFPDGYGSIKVHGKMVGAHRVAWTLAHGDPGALHVLHRCDTRLCVNPDHLFLGTNADNVADRCRKGRGSRKLTAAQVNVIRDRWRAGGVSQGALAREYGIRPDNVSRLLSGKNHKHVEVR